MIRTLFLVFLPLGAVHAQFSVDFYGEFQVGIPQGDFRKKVELNGKGFAVGVLFGDTRLPVQFGAELGLQFFRRVFLNYSHGQILPSPINIERQMVIKNTLFLGHAVFRVKPPLDFVLLPYADGMIGLKNTYTRIKLNDNLDPNQPILIDSRTENEDLAFSYGGAIGVQWSLSGGAESGILLDFRCAFLPGSRVDFLADPDGLGQIDQLEDYDNIESLLEPRTAKSTLIMPQVGVIFRL